MRKLYERTAIYNLARGDRFMHDMHCYTVCVPPDRPRSDKPIPCVCYKAPARSTMRPGRIALLSPTWQVAYIGDGLGDAAR